MSPAQPPPEGFGLSEEAGRELLELISAVSRRLLAVSHPYAAQYNLAPRGLWILGRVRAGVVHPGDLARQFHVGPSLLTAEARRLVAAGLLTSEPDPADARRARLSLTAEGEAVYLRMWNDLVTMLAESLAGHPERDRQIFLRVLAALAG